MSKFIYHDASCIFHDFSLLFFFTQPRQHIYELIVCRNKDIPCCLCVQLFLICDFCGMRITFRKTKHRNRSSEPVRERKDCILRSWTFFFIITYGNRSKLLQVEVSVKSCLCWLSVQDEQGVCLAVLVLHSQSLCQGGRC